MGGQYQTRPGGIDGLAKKLSDLQRQIDSIRSAAGIKSALIGEGGLTVYDPDTGARAYIGQGAIKIWDDFIDNPDGYGRIYSDPDSGLNYFRFFPPYKAGNGLQNSITIKGDDVGNDGNIWLYSDGTIQITTQDIDANPVGRIQLVTPELGLFNLPTTSSGANLFLGTVAGKWTVALVTSSRRYKQDIEDARVDPTDVLALRGRTWRDKLEVEADRDSKKRFVGFIAEELDDHPTLRQFVTYDDEGRPDAIAYDRLSVALVELAKDQEARLRDQEQRLGALESRLAALEGAIAG